MISALHQLSVVHQKGPSPCGDGPGNSLKMDPSTAGARRPIKTTRTGSRHMSLSITAVVSLEVKLIILTGL
jgi:hypothetical protein